MKKIIVLSTALIASSVLFSAFAADAPFSNAPAPTQSYHMEGTTTSAQPTSVTQPAIATQQPAAFSQQAELTGNSDYLAQPATAATSSSSPTAQNDATFQQNETQEIQNLNESNQAMGLAIQTIDQNVAQLQQEVNVLQSTHTQQSFLHAFDRQDADDFIVFAGAAAFLVLLGLLIGKMIRRKPSLAIASAMSTHRVGDLLGDDTKSEYDFMGTKAAIPAKLDLARSYMAMNDHDQARAVLKTVLEKGDEEQRMVAEALLIKIHKNSKAE